MVTCIVVSDPKQTQVHSSMIKWVVNFKLSNVDETQLSLAGVLFLCILCCQYVGSQYRNHRVTLELQAYSCRVTFLHPACQLTKLSILLPVSFTPQMPITSLLQEQVYVARCPHHPTLPVILPIKIHAGKNQRCLDYTTVTVTLQ